MFSEALLPGKKKSALKSFFCSVFDLESFPHYTVTDVCYGIVYMEICYVVVYYFERMLFFCFLVFFSTN